MNRYVSENKIVTSPKPFSEKQKFLTRNPLEDNRILSGDYWDECRVFLALAKAGSFAKAEEIINVSSQTITRKVQRLAYLLNAQLLIKTKTGIKLTPNGEELALRLAHIDYQFHVIGLDFKVPRRDLEGSVRISATEGLSAVFVSTNLSRFRDLHPKVQIHVKIPININNLKHNHADILIGFQKVTDSELVCRQLGYLNLVTVASKGYIGKFGTPSAENISDHLFVDSEFYAATTGMWASWSNMVKRGTVSSYVDSSLAYGMAIREGQGIGLLGNYVLVDKEFCYVNLGVHVQVPIFIVGLAERLQSKSVSAVFDWLENIFGVHNPWFGEQLELTSLPDVSLTQSVNAIFSAAGASD